MPDTGGSCLLLCASVSRVFRSGKDNEDAMRMCRRGDEAVVLIPQFSDSRDRRSSPSFSRFFIFDESQNNRETRRQLSRVWLLTHDTLSSLYYK